MSPLTEPTRLTLAKTSYPDIRNGIVTSGLVLNLDAAQTASYPGTGTTWTDLSGNGNNGTLVNGPTYSSANYGSIVFDGSNDYVIGNTPSGLNVSQSCSINVWVNFSNFTKVNPRILEVRDGSNSLQILRDSATTFLATKNSSFQADFDSTTWLVPSLSTWYNISAVWQPSISNTTLYLNGILQSSSGSTLVGTGNQANKYVLGDRSDFVSSTGLAGYISQVSIYNRALTAAEVQQNFNCLRMRYGL